jgi:exonuclease VII large subunit
VGEEEDSHLGDFIEDKRIITPSDAVVNINLQEQTRKVLATLDAARRAGPAHALSASVNAPITLWKKLARNLPSRASASVRSKPKLSVSTPPEPQQATQKLHGNLERG